MEDSNLIYWISLLVAVILLQIPIYFGKRFWRKHIRGRDWKELADRFLKARQVVYESYLTLRELNLDLLIAGGIIILAVAILLSFRKGPGE